MKLSVRLAIAHREVSLVMAKRPTAKNTGGPNMMRIPPRVPRRAPHPKPGHPSMCTTPKIQGDKAKKKLVLPNVSDFILLYFLLKQRNYVDTLFYCSSFSILKVAVGGLFISLIQMKRRIGAIKIKATMRASHM